MIWYGSAGHFCAAGMCKFHLCTEVGEYLVSTIGEYYPKEKGKMEPIGAGLSNFYETYVFNLDGTRCGCGCGLPGYELSEIEGIRYETPKEANEGHMEMIEKYQKLDNKTEES